MFVLPASLEAFRTYKQFILTHNKRPVTIHGYHFDWRKPENRYFIDEIIPLAEKLNYRIGFVFTEEDPFWFLDIDRACINGQWSSLANELCQLFPHAALEVSSSGTGLHLFGTGITSFPGRRNTVLDIEFYTHGHYVVLTGYHTRGNADQDYSAILPTFLSSYFKEVETLILTNLTSAPHPDSDPPANDEILIAKALKSKSAKHIFAGTASFQDIWENNEEVLSKQWPPKNPHDPYDRSAIDMALAQHLAFWTGNHGERMLDLMRQSVHDRPKWNNRDDYLPRTLAKACAQQTVFFGSKKKQSETELITHPESPIIHTSNDLGWKDISIHDVITHPSAIPQFVIESLVPRGTLTLLSANGGAGKSMLALQAAICVVFGRPFMGKMIQRGRVLFYSGEDATNMVRNRIKKICHHMGLNPLECAESLCIIDATKTPGLYLENDYRSTQRVLTPGYFELQRRLDEFKPDLIIIDNASDTFNANENDRARVSEFLRSLIDFGESHNAGVLLLAHVDKAQSRGQVKEGHAFSGSTAWHNRPRSRLFLTSEDQVVRLEQQKLNLGLHSDPIYMAWGEGVLVHLPNPTVENLEPVILKLIADCYAQEIYISPFFNRPNNAYKVLSDNTAYPHGVSKAQLEIILKNLQNKKLLVVEIYRSYRRDRSRFKA